jgi:molybdopterin synthase catalytic subunit
MRVHVIFFGRLKEIVGHSEEDAEVSEGARVEDLFLRYIRRHPDLAGFRSSVVAAVNQQFAEWGMILSAGDEVAFLPPVSGGGAPRTPAEQGAGPAAEICELVRAPIRTAEIVAQLKAPEDGAAAVFEGIVRNHSGGRATLYLEYFAYEPMALAKMREIVAEMLRRFSVHRVALVHRLGRLEIGETSVLIAVCSAHRAAAFDACRFGIDTLKRIVPIWKKEYFQDGAVWAEGVRPEQSFSGSDESIP